MPEHQQVQGTAVGSDGPLDVSVLLLRATDETFATLRPAVSPLLSAAEQVEFDRIRSPAARGRRIACRGWLRWWLGGLLGIDPAKVPLQRSVNGRIELVMGPFGFFNVSQSDGVIAIALVDPLRSHAPLQLGVDVEAMQRRWSLDLAAALFSQRELAWMLEQPEQQRDAAFLSLWALREALIKADGRGVSLDLGLLQFMPENAPPWRTGDCPGLVRPKASELVDPAHWCCWLQQSADAACAIALHCHDMPPSVRISMRTLNEADAVAAMQRTDIPGSAVAEGSSQTELFVAAQRR